MGATRLVIGQLREKCCCEVQEKEWTRCLRRRPRGACSCPTAAPLSMDPTLAKTRQSNNPSADMKGDNVVRWKDLFVERQRRDVEWCAAFG